MVEWSVITHSIHRKRCKNVLLFLFPLIRLQWANYTSEVLCTHADCRGQNKVTRRPVGGATATLLPAPPSAGPRHCSCQSSGGYFHRRLFPLAFGCYDYVNIVLQLILYYNTWRRRNFVVIVHSRKRLSFRMTVAAHRYIMAMAMGMARVVMGGFARFIMQTWNQRVPV